MVFLFNWRKITINLAIVYLWYESNFRLLRCEVTLYKERRSRNYLGKTRKFTSYRFRHANQRPQGVQFA